LRCEYRVNPLGVDVPSPRLSWQLESGRRGQKQSAYRILVASSRDRLDKDVGDLWDSGKVEGDQLLNVIYDGAPLQSRHRYVWKVKVWGENGQEAVWSDAASWGMGVLSPEAWKGQWIESDLSLYDYQVELKKMPDHELELKKMEDGKEMWDRGREIRKTTMTKVTEAPAVWMRKEFRSEEQKLQKATLFISGLGLYEAYLNGSKINDHLLNVSPHDFGKTVPYHVHDVTAQVKNGANVLGVILGNGYFNPVVPSLLREYAFDFIDTPRLKCELQLEYENGSIQQVLSDASWKFSTDGPIRFNSIRSGETYDARKELGSWSAPDYDDNNWKTAKPAEAPQGRMRQRTLPPVRVIKNIPAVSVKPHKKGYRFDIGVESTGWALIKLRGRKGQKITIKYPGTASHTLGRYQTFEYICKGTGDEFYEPRFAFTGYQYIDVEGLDYTPSVTDLVGRQVVSDLQPIGSFSCSNEQLNTLHEVNLRTIRNYHVTMPLDPVREKVCWTQDVQSNFETSAYNYDLHAIYRKWQDDYIDSTQVNGFVPTVVPSCFDGPIINGPWWGGMLIYNPWQLYNFYGDKEVLAGNYDAMKHHMSYYESIAKDNIVHWGLGDWQDAAVQKSKGGFGGPRATTVPFTSTCAYFHYADILHRTALLLGKSNDAVQYRKKREAIRKSLHEAFYNAETGIYDKGTQTSYVLPLRLNITEKENRPRIIENFVKQVAKDDDHLTCGFVGMPFLLTELTEIGHGDLAWKIATQETWPSWFDLIFNRKKTVFMEAWDGGHVQMPSLCGSIGAWFYRSLAGIRSETPGFKSFIIAPYTETLDWVKSTFECPYGEIRSDWKKIADELVMDITIPPNTSATIYVPADIRTDVTESGVPIGEAEGVTFLRMENGKAVIYVDAGRYSFVSK
jgi:alpha-L-rhamnosidase